MYYLMIEGKLENGVLVEPDQFLKTEIFEKAVEKFANREWNRHVTLSNRPIILEEDDFVSFD